MRQLILLAALTMTIVGCKTTSTVHRYRGPEKLVVIEDSPKIFANTKGTVGDEIGKGPWKKLDTLYAYASMSVGYGMMAEWHYLTLKGQDSVWVNYKQVCTEVASRARFMLSASVPKEQSDEAWSRTTDWINKNSDMKVQTASDNLISTYNPIKAGDYGYTATRLISGNNVKITVECQYKAPQYDMQGNGCLSKMRAAHLYIQTGESIFYQEIP